MDCMAGVRERRGRAPAGFFMPPDRDGKELADASDGVGVGRGRGG